jgi:hypothetical protein
MVTVNGVVLLRRDTEANWAYVNPMIADGEAALSTDIKNFKVGPGLWADLDYWIKDNPTPNPHPITAGVTPMPTTIAFASTTYPNWNAVKTDSGVYDTLYPVTYNMTLQRFEINAMDNGSGKALENYVLTINP